MDQKLQKWGRPEITEMGRTRNYRNGGVLEIIHFICTFEIRCGVTWEVPRFYFQIIPAFFTFQ